jgi:four helix bundle protein
MATIDRFEDIEAWKAGRKLRQTVYRLTRNKAFSTDFGLVDQIRRAAVSITSNIAEGFERGGNREFIQFLSHAKGSAGEVKDQLYCALDEKYITQPEFDHAYGLASDATKLIGGFMSYLRQSESKGYKFPPTATSRSRSQGLNAEL